MQEEPSLFLPGLGKGRMGSWPPTSVPHFMSTCSPKPSDLPLPRLTELGLLTRSSSCRGSSRGACEGHRVWAKPPAGTWFEQMPGTISPRVTGHLATHLAVKLVYELLETVDLQSPLHLCLRAPPWGGGERGHQPVSLRLRGLLG
jgi:hypothetical protein